MDLQISISDYKTSVELIIKLLFEAEMIYLTDSEMNLEDKKAVEETAKQFLETIRCHLV